MFQKSFGMIRLWVNFVLIANFLQSLRVNKISSTNTPMLIKVVIFIYVISIRTQIICICMFIHRCMYAYKCMHV